MFRVNHKPTFSREVRVQVPDGEGTVEETFTATFVLLDEDDAAPEALGESVVAFLRKAIVGLDDLADEAGQPLPYTPEVRDAVIRRLDARGALIRTYYAAAGEATVGNLNGPPAPGQRAGS